MSWRRVTDLQALGSLSSQKEDCRLVVDTTFATPYNQRVLGVDGVDVALHSATKYLSGHSGWCLGFVGCYLGWVCVYGCVYVCMCV